MRDKLSVAINVIGLAIGLATCMLIMLFVLDETSYDTHWSKADNIYRLTMTRTDVGAVPKHYARVPLPTKAAFNEYFSEEIESATGLVSGGGDFRAGDKRISEPPLLTDPGILSVFDFKTVSGDLAASLKDKSSISISQSMAQNYFGTDAAVGELVTSKEKDYYIGAVFEDLPHNTMINATLLLHYDLSENRYSDNWFVLGGYLYFALKDGVSIDTVSNQLEDFVNANVPAGETGKASDFFSFSAQAITDIHLNPIASFRELKPKGNPNIVVSFAVIAVLILLIGGVNFVNLATMKSTQRAREVAMRKVLGAKRRQVAVQFFGESLLLTISAFLLGLCLMELTVPLFSAFLDIPFEYSYLDGAVLGTIAVLFVVISLLGGVYPALVISRFLPAKVLSSSHSSEGKISSKMRSTLVVFQFFISTILLMAMMIVYGQRQYLTDMDPGFDREKLLLINNINVGEALPKQQAFKQELLRLASVKAVGRSLEKPMGRRWGKGQRVVNLTGNAEDSSVRLSTQWVDHDFFDTYTISLLAGRTYSQERSNDGLPKASNDAEGEWPKAA